MEPNQDSKIICTMLEDDERTGYKKGDKFHPKGVYWHKKNIITVGSIEADHVIRLKFKQDKVKVDIK